VHEWFLCGPAGLVDLARKVLADCGVPRQQVHSELFWVGASVPAPGSAVSPGRHTVTARLDGRTTTFTMPPTGSILDAVLAHRPEAPYACKGGVCGTCRIRVLEGQVVMAGNYALDPQDLLSVRAHKSRASDRLRRLIIALGTVCSR
jgi:ring-1,2-phenylacetyl-CoA epoxidase subunit PaaE